MDGKLFFAAIIASLMRISQASADPVGEGKAVAEQHCSRCHVVGDYNPNGGISSTPSFQLLVNALKDYEERFDTFFDRPPHPAVIIIKHIKKRDDLPFNAAPVKITFEDVENIALFVKTLRK
ncbi:MAG: cytochrome c [Hyphomicrobiales bacterium]|nr:cytochrome c [Hyphomicrobiales bacterium]